MKPIKTVFIALLSLITLLWVVCEPSVFSTLDGIFAWRGILNQYSGILGISVMSVAMILALRVPILENYLGGLDKMYRLHKWLGISGLVISILHWLIANGPKWAVGLGWLERRGRPQRPVFPEGSLQQWFASQHGLAETVGEWAFYVAAVLMVLALVKYFPYRQFFQTHRILAVTYLALVYHAIILAKYEYWASPLGVFLALLLMLGTASAVLCLMRKRLGGQRVEGQIEALEWQPELRCLSVLIRMDAGWPGHVAGQFAFATFHADEGPHPFTIASAGSNDGRLRFIIKTLGDYTRRLPERLKVGDRVTVEGPYGRFNFHTTGRRQIWISGGIGITPFIARMHALANQSRNGAKGQLVDLFHSTLEMTPEILQRLENDAVQAGVNLHLFWDKRFEITDMLTQVSEWKDAEVWFCGPAQFGQSVYTKLVKLGLPAARFHRELFAMR